MRKFVYKDYHTRYTQGSILGPTLSLLYINDFFDDFIYNSAAYADDSTL